MAKVVMNDEWYICDVWDHVLVIGITTCMLMSMKTAGAIGVVLIIVWPACQWFNAI